MFPIKYIGLVILLHFHSIIPEFDCKVDNTERFFALETADNDEVTLSFPLFTNKLIFGIQIGSSYCPKIVFSNHAQNSSVTPSLIVYFCSNLCILKSSGTEIIRKPFTGLLNDKYRGFWILFDQPRGIITVGERNEEKSVLEYPYANRLEFKDDFVTHYAFGGYARWIVEETTEDVMAENVNADYATTFFPLLGNTIEFGIKFSTRVSTKCPRIEFHDRPVKNNPHYLSFFFCKTSYGVTDGPTILQEVPGILVNNKWHKGYWIRLNQKSNKFSVGKNLNSTPFFQYSYGNRFKDPFFTYYSFVGLVKMTLLTNNRDQ